MSSSLGSRRMARVWSGPNRPGLSTKGRFIAKASFLRQTERMNRFTYLVAAAAAALTATSAAAHDFFLIPESFQAQPGGFVLRATVGSSFPAPEIVVTADRAERTWVIGNGKPQLHVTGTDAKSLLLHVADAQPGKLIVAVKAKPRDVEYAEDRIALILEEYRVAPTAVAAVERLSKPRTWKVVSRRFAKTLVCVRECSGGAATNRPLDGTLEFVTHGPNAEHFQLIAGGRPAGNYPIDLVAGGKRQNLMTDASGVVHVPATSKGTMMLFAAVLTPPRAAERFTLDLTSLTFNR